MGSSGVIDLVGVSDSDDDDDFVDGLGAARGGTGNGPGGGSRSGAGAGAGGGKSTASKCGGAGSGSSRTAMERDGASAARLERAREELHRVDDEIAEVECRIGELMERQDELVARRAELQALVDGSGTPESSAAVSPSSSVAVKRFNDMWRGSFPWDDAVTTALRSTFGIHTGFRQHQREVINCTLSGCSAVVVMPTGGGKSLTYQLPAALHDASLPGGAASVTLVVSPLLALMEDQVHELRKVGIEGRLLTGSQSREQTTETYRLLKKPPDAAKAIRMLFVTPERVAKSKLLISTLEKVHDAGRLARIVVDEAHCVSTWGHDFRADYKQLSILRIQFPSVPVLALTATATPQTVTDVARMLRITGADVFRSSINRPNLRYSVVAKREDRKGAAEQQLVDLIGSFGSGKSGIVYVLSRRETESIAGTLFSKGIAAAPYHGSMEARERTSVLQDWLRGDVTVVVATVAFGLGVNKLDVAWVIHFTLPKSLGSYYQESGRAGRSGDTAACVMLYSRGDTFRMATLVSADYSGTDNLLPVVAYCEQRHECRRAVLSRYFGESSTSAECDGHCDVCSGTAGPAGAVDRTDYARDLLAHVAEACSGSDRDRQTFKQLTKAWLLRLRKLHRQAAKRRKTDGGAQPGAVALAPLDVVDAEALIMRVRWPPTRAPLRDMVANTAPCACSASSTGVLSSLSTTPPIPLLPTSSPVLARCGSTTR